MLSRFYKCLSKPLLLKKKIQNRISKPLSKHWSWDSTLNWIMFITHKSCLKLIFSDKTIALVCGRCLTMHPFFWQLVIFNLLLWYGDLECPKKMPTNNIYYHHYYQYYLPRGPLICAADSTRTLTQRQHSTQKHNNDDSHEHQEQADNKHNHKVWADTKTQCANGEQ